jgi:hypothetical protein
MTVSLLVRVSVVHASAAVVPSGVLLVHVLHVDTHVHGLLVTLILLRSCGLCFKILLYYLHVWCVSYIHPLQPQYCPGVDSVFNRNEYKESS